MKKTTASRREFIKGSTCAGLTLAAGLGHTAANAQAMELNAMSPTPQQVQEFLALPEQPVVMVNLLKFKADGGAEQYARYVEGVEPLLRGIGARILFSSTTALCLIGNGDWDAIALVEYPRPAALIQMSSSPEYRAISGFREAGLEGQVNYAVWENA